MSTVIERARWEAENTCTANKAPAFINGATFAATITPEQVEAFKRGWEEADARGESGSRVIAGLRAMGFEVPS